MRLSLFNTFATPVAFGTQRSVARAVRFGEKTQAEIEQDLRDAQVRDAQEKDFMTKHLQQQFDQAKARRQEEAEKSQGEDDADDEGD